MKDLITIEEVCDLAQVSKPTVYRKVKVGEFPSPVKVPTTASRGPKMVNRWERGAILAWCFKNNAERLAVDVAVEARSSRLQGDPRARSPRRAEVHHLAVVREGPGTYPGLPGDL